MIGLPVCEERTASSTHCTDQKIYLVFEIHAHVLCNVYFIFRTGCCVTEMGTEKPSMCRMFVNQHKQRVWGHCAGAGFQALLLHVVSLACPHRADDNSGHRMLFTHRQFRQKSLCLWAVQNWVCFAQGSAGYIIGMARLSSDFQSSLRSPCNGGVLNNMCLCNILRSVSACIEERPCWLSRALWHFS